MVDVYNLKLKKSFFSVFLESYCTDAQKYYADVTEPSVEHLKRLVSENDCIDATQLQEDWFPQIDVDVFISHSHRDKKLATALSGWLLGNFNLKPFVDSCVWGCADKLLKKIDDRYCRTDEGYSYGRRNVSTTHVHMMLFSALMEMIAKSQCIFFLNTPNSLSAIKTNNGYTNSAWIYAELMFAKIIAKKENQNLQKSITGKNINLRYRIDMNTFWQIDKDDLALWFAAKNKIFNVPNIKGHL